MSKHKKHKKINIPDSEIIKPEKSRIRPTLVVVIIYLLLLLFVFAPILLKPINSADAISQQVPTTLFNKTYLLKHHTLPFWYPYMSGGTPYLEGMHFNHIFDIITYILPIELALFYRTLIFTFLSGFFCFLFLKSLGFSNIIATIAGMVYMLSGDAVTYTTLMHYGKIVNMAFLPLALLFINHGFYKKKYIYFLFSGLAVSFMFRGHPQLFYYNLIIISVYYLFKTIFEYKEKKDKAIFKFAIISFTIIGFTTILLSFDNLYHQMQFVKMTSRVAESSPIRQWNYATSWSQHPLEMLTYFVPSIFGLQGGTYIGWKPFVSNSDYVGVLVIFIALFGIIYNWKNKYIKLFTFITIFSIMFGFGKHFALYYKLFYNYVPLIKAFRVPATIYITVAFFIIYFFAYGLKSIVEMDLKQTKDKKLLKYFIVSILVIVVLLTIFIKSDSYQDILKNTLAAKIKANNPKVTDSQIQAHINKLSSQVNSPFAQTTYLAEKGLTPLWVFSIAFILFLFLLHSGTIRIKTFLVLLSILMFIDLYIIDKKFIHAIDNYDIVTKETDVIKFLKRDKSKFRIIPFPPRIDNEVNKWGLFGLESAHGYNAIALHIYDSVQNAGLLYNLKFLGLFNVKYLLTKKQYNDPNLEEVYRGSKIVYKNKLFLPRLFFVKNYKVITNSESVLNYLKSNEFNPAENIVLEEKPDIENKSETSSKTNSVKIINYDLDEINLKAEVNNPSFLFLSDVYYPKWECFVNGEKVKIYKANYLFRAIYLTEGNYKIVFKYKNEGVYWIMALFSLLSTIAVIYLLLKNREKYFSKFS